MVYWQALERACSKQTLSNGVNIPNSSHLTICLRTFVIVNKFVPSPFT